MSLTDGAGYVCFRAMHDYAPQAPAEIQLKVNDECLVKKPIQDAMGWLEGVNMRSKDNGQFPGTYCEILNYNAELPRPPKPPTRMPSMFVMGFFLLVSFYLTKIIVCM